MKTHWKKTFNKDYLGSWDLENEVNAVILKMRVDDVPDSTGKKSKCNVAVLKDLKPMILNTIACKQIQGFTGSKYLEDWTNVPITIHVVKGKAFGEDMEMLRIKDKQPIKPVLSGKKWNDAIKYVVDFDVKDRKTAFEKISSKYNIDAAKFWNEVGRSTPE